MYWLWCVPRVIFPKLRDQEEAGERVGMLLENSRVIEREIETKKQRETERDTEKKRQMVRQRDTERDTETDREKHILTEKRHIKKDREREKWEGTEREREKGEESSVTISGLRERTNRKKSWQRLIGAGEACCKKTGSQVVWERWGSNQGEGKG